MLGVAAATAAAAAGLGVSEASATQAFMSVLDFDDEHFHEQLNELWGELGESENVVSLREEDPHHALRLRESLKRLFSEGLMCDVVLHCPPSDHHSGSSSGGGGGSGAGGAVSETGSVASSSAGPQAGKRRREGSITSLGDLDGLPAEAHLHSVIAAASSPTLLKLIRGTQAEFQRKRVPIPMPLTVRLDPAHISAVALLPLVRYMYVGAIELSSISVREFLRAACYLEMEGVRDLCADFITSRLEPQNALGSLACALECGCVDVRDAAAKFVDLNIAKVHLESEWTDATPECMEYVLSRDSLQIDRELDVFRYLIKWAQRNEEVVRSKVSFHIGTAAGTGAGTSSGAASAAAAVPSGRRVVAAVNHSPDSSPRDNAGPRHMLEYVGVQAGSWFERLFLEAVRIEYMNKDELMEVSRHPFVAMSQLLKAAMVKEAERRKLQLEPPVRRSKRLHGGGRSSLRQADSGPSSCQHTLVGHTRAVCSLVVCGDKLISGSADCTIKVWDLFTWTCVKTIMGHEHSIVALRIAGFKLVSASPDKTVRVWDTQTWECEQILNHNSPVTSLAVIGLGSAKKRARCRNRQRRDFCVEHRNVGVRPDAAGTQTCGVVFRRERLVPD